MNDDEWWQIPRWYEATQKQIEILRGSLTLLEERDELRVISMKRGSRRWLPPRPA